MLATDSLDYAILENAVRQAPKGNYLSCEIGVREGGSSQMIMETLSSSFNLGYTHVTIDHYGEMPQAHSDSSTVVLDYNNSMRNRAIPELYKISEQTKINFLFMNMDDTEYFSRYADGVPVYSNSKKSIVNTYGFVFFDGPHETSLVKREVEFFIPRTIEDGIFVLDDVSNFKLHVIDKLLIDSGFEQLEHTDTKASYKRIAID